MPAACSREALVISPMMSVTRCTLLTTCCMVLPASEASAAPLPMRATESSMRCLISLAAPAERWARVRTSEATTAKPRPCSPARAASTAAFKARMLVWNAMPSMTLMISAIFLDEASMSAMVLTTRPTTSPPCAATPAAFNTRRLAWSALSAFCLTVAVSSSMEAAVSSSAAACCSVRRERSLLPVAISVAAELIASEESLIRRTMPASWSAVALASSRMVANTPCRSPSMRAVRSPCDSDDSSADTRDRPSALLSSNMLSCCASCSKKPCLPAVPTRPLRSPAAAACTIRATSSSTCTSWVRSAHSTTKPMRSPAAFNTGLTT